MDHYLCVRGDMDYALHEVNLLCIFDYMKKTNLKIKIIVCVYMDVSYRTNLNAIHFLKKIFVPLFYIY